MSDLQYSLKPLAWNSEFKEVLKLIEKEIQILEDDKKRKLASYYTSIAIGGYLGVHSRQLLAIRWKDILKKKKTDSFWNNNSKGHHVNFHSELIEIIRRNYEICRPFADHYLIVSNPLKNQKPLIDRTFNNTLSQILGSKGFDIGKEGSHILRKTAALRIYHEKGKGQEALQYVSEFLNHRSLGMTKAYLCLTESS